MRRRLAAWLLLSLVGVVLVALPDEDDRLFSLSEAHGPSQLDAVGSVLLVVGWAIVAPAIWSGRSRLRQRRFFEFGLFGLGLGAGLVVASAAGDFAWWWAIGACILVVVQALAVAALLRSR